MAGGGAGVGGRVEDVGAARVAQAVALAERGHQPVDVGEAGRPAAVVVVIAGAGLVLELGDATEAVFGLDQEAGTDQGRAARGAELLELPAGHVPAVDELGNSVSVDIDQVDGGRCRLLRGVVVLVDPVATGQDLGGVLREVDDAALVVGDSPLAGVDLDKIRKTVPIDISKILHHPFVIQFSLQTLVRVRAAAPGRHVPNDVMTETSTAIEKNVDDIGEGDPAAVDGKFPGGVLAVVPRVVPGDVARGVEGDAVIPPVVQVIRQPISIHIQRHSVSDPLLAVPHAVVDLREGMAALNGDALKGLASVLMDLPTGRRVRADKVGQSVAIPIQ